MDGEGGRAEGGSKLFQRLRQLQFLNDKDVGQMKRALSHA